MGTDAHVIVTSGTETDLDLAEARIERLEARWSRFRPDSELCILNARAGRPTVVSRDTALLVDRCFIAWSRTLGAFDPSVHDALIANGYDRDFAQLEDGADGPSRRAARAPGLDGTIVDAARGLVWLRPGVHLDAGAIGKGLAADLVCHDLRAAGAEGACVNLGGDVRVTGAAPNGDTWTVSIEDPFEPDRELARIGLGDGAVATSSRIRRAWRRGEERMHHVVDPRTGRPAAGSVAAVTTIARKAWWAEVAATSALLATDPLKAPGVISVLAVHEDGDVRCTPDLEEALTCSAR
jgi:thiamine biosynthesis lipoprotein